MKKIVVAVLDFILLYLSLYLISYLHWGVPNFWEASNAIVYDYRYHVIAFNVIVLYFVGLYGPMIASKSFVIIRAFLTQAFVVIFLGFIVFFFRIEDSISRFLMFYYFIITVLIIFINRLFVHKMAVAFGKKQDVILIGNYKNTKRLLLMSKFFKYHNLNILGYISLEDSSKNKTFKIFDKTVLYLGILDNLIKDKNIINKNIKLIITEHELKPSSTKIIEELTLKNYNIDVIPDFYEIAYGKAYMDFTFNVPLIKFGLAQKEFYFFIKRLFDVIVSIILLVLFSPIFLIVSILIPLESKGSPFYIQERIGRYGKPFNIIKFRSMYRDAEKSGPVFSAGDNDTRITKLGRFLRKTRIDELPQLLCVIWGTMSLIGPRPERKVFTSKFSKDIKFYNLRHLVRPGITGWAQVNFRYTATVEDTAEKLKYDLFYVKNMSIDLDLEILFKTVAVVLLRKGI